MRRRGGQRERREDKRRKRETISRMRLVNIKGCLHISLKKIT